MTMNIAKYITVAGIAILAATSVPTDVNAQELVLISTNDTHSQLDPDDMDGLGGILRRKVLVDSIRAAHPNVLLIDDGDAVQGTLYFNLFKGKVEEEMMNRLGYDIRILGNHEFDNGTEALADLLKGSTATLLTSNYDLTDTPLDGLFKPYLIKEYDGKKVGFIAINLDPKGMIADVNAKGVKYLDAVKAANSLAWYLKNIEKVDKVVAITHIGYDMDGIVDDIDIVGNSTDIDLVLGGHSHTLLDPANPKTPASLLPNADKKMIDVTQSGKGGKNITEIVLDLGSDKAPVHKVIRVDSRLDDRIDASLDSILMPYRAEIDKSMKHKIGRTAFELNKNEAPLLNYIADFVLDRGKQLADNVDLAIVNKGGIRRSLPKGDITEGMIITMLPFSNRVQVLDIKGKDLLDAFNVMVKTDGNGLSRGMDVTYDKASDKVTSATLNGQPIDPDRTYRLATIDYLAMGGDYMSSLKNGQLVASSDHLLHDDVLNYITKGAGKGKKINPDKTVRMHQ